MASLKVGSRLSYHAAARGRTAPVGARASSLAQTLTTYQFCPGSQEKLFFLFCLLQDAVAGLNQGRSFHNKLRRGVG